MIAKSAPISHSWTACVTPGKLPFASIADPTPGSPSAAAGDVSHVQQEPVRAAGDLVDAAAAGGARPGQVLQQVSVGRTGSGRGSDGWVGDGETVGWDIPVSCASCIAVQLVQSGKI